MLAPHLKLIGYLILAEARTNMRALIRTNLMNLRGTQILVNTNPGANYNMEDSMYVLYEVLKGD